ncbi:MAG TPA: hypothetical protein VKR32_07755, partial [Puia sp.]|nr:hypothetical protein [Puia sp.]
MKSALVVVVVTLLFVQSFGQKKINAVNNVSRKSPGEMASIVKDTLNRWLSLNPVQSDSVEKIYSEFFTRVNELQS